MQKGFHMTFANGLTASVQWGAGNYCDNQYDGDFSFRTPVASTNAEVAVIDRNGDLLDNIKEFLPEGVLDDGSVAGWLTPEQVVYFLKKVSEKA